MDDTQRLDYNDDEEETTVNRDRPAGNLHMFAGIHGPAQDFPIFRGQNIIGRHANCDITLPAQSVSKKHAILEVRGDCHTICDNGSLNKTRRGKIALAPDVHYALSDGDFLLFADVACRYTVQDKVETETTGVEDSEDDSVLVPPTQGALSIEKTPGAAIRRIARGAVLARDSGDEDEEEDRQTRRQEGGCGSIKDSLKTSSATAIFPPDADTIVPESDEEIDTSTSETHFPSLNLSSDTDTSRRSSFVPCSQNISTPVVLKDQSKLSGRTLTAVDKEEMESRKPTDADMKLSLAVEDPLDSKENQVETVESTSGGIVPEPPVELVGTTDGNVKKQQECEKLLQDDALSKPSSESIPVSSPCDEDDNVASSRSETVQEAPSESNPKTDASMQHNNVQLSDTDVNPKEDNVSSDRESDIQEDATKSETGANTAETSGIQSNKTEEDGNGGALGSGGAQFHMDSDTDVDDDEDKAATTGPDLEKAETRHLSKMKESEKNENSVTSGNEGESDSDTDVEDDLNVTKSKSDDEVNKTKDEPNKSAGFGIDSDTDDDADIPKPAENSAEQGSKSNIEENNTTEQDSKSTNEGSNVEQDSKSNIEENNSEQDSKSFNEESDAEQDSKSTNEGSNAEQDLKSNNEENNAEQDSKSNNEENNAEQDSKSNIEENNTEQDSKSNNEGSNAEQDSKSDTEENNIEQDSKSNIEENNTEQDSKSNTEENNAEHDSKSDTEERKEEFHMDSDTDVEEDVSTAEVKETEPESSKASGKETKDVFNLDSDTDVDEDADVSSKDVSCGPQDSSTASANVKEETGVDSDTDVDEEDQIPDGSNVALGKTSTDEPKVVATEAAALHVDSDTDVDDDDDVAPQGTTHTDSTKTGSEITKAEELHLDSDTDVEEDDAEEGKVDTGGVLEKAGVDQKSSSSTNEAAAVSGISTEQTENVPAQIAMEDDETQKSESESIDLEMMPTQCFLEPQEESELQDEEEATQAFILSSTWAEPDPFKRPADPIGVLQISSVTLNTSEEEIDENAEAETQAFCSEAEPRGPSLQETPEPAERSVDETVLSSSSGEESEKEVQQLPHEPVSQDATQPVSQCLSGRPPQETNTWVHLKRDVPASVWIRGIQQEGDSTDLEGSKETAEDETQAYEQSLNLELEATQSYVEESPSLQKSPVHTDAPAVPTAEEDAAPDVPSEKVEQPCSEDTQASESDATRPYSPSPTGLGVDDGSTQASAGDDATQAVSILPVDTEDDDTQVVTPSVPAAEEVVPETSTTKSKEKLSLRRGLSRSKKKVEPAQNLPTSPITEEPLDKGSAGPGCLSAEPDQQSTGKPSEPEIKEVQVEKEVRRLGGRRIAESQDKDTAKDEVPVAATSRKRTSKISSEDEPSTSGVSEQGGLKKISRKSTIKEVNEELKEERKQSSSNTEEINESAATEILPVNPPEEMESVSSVDDKKGTMVQQISEDFSDQASLGNKEILCTEAPVSSTVVESEEPMEENDNSAEKEPESRQDKKTARNKRQVATRLKGEADKEEENIDHNIKTSQEKDTSKQTSKPLQTQQEESQGRKATRKSRVKPSEQDSDEVQDTTGTAEENKKTEEVGPASQASGNENSKRTRRSLKEHVKEESENVQEGKGRTKRSTSVKDFEPKHEEKGNEEMPESDKRPKRTKNNSKKDATKPEEVKEDVKTEENESVTKPTRARKNIKEQQKPEDNIETQETSNSDSQSSRRTRRECLGEDKIDKEKTVKETHSRRTRRNSKEEDAVKLEDQTKKSRRTIKGSKEETKTKETVEESPPDNKEETVEKKATRKTRKNVKDDETSVCEKEPKQTEHNSKPERSSRTRAKASDESKESHEDVNKATEESHKLSPQEEMSKPTGGRGRRAAKKEDIPQVTTPVSSRKREQATKASDRSKELHEDLEETHKLSPLEETSKPAGGRGRRAAKKDDVSQVSTPVASRKREQATKASDRSKELHEDVEGITKGAEESQKLSPQEETSKPVGGRGRRAAKKDDAPQISTPVASRKREQATKASDQSKELHEDVEGITKGAEESQKLSPQEETSKPAGGRGRRAAKKDDVSQVSTPVASRKREQATKASDKSKELHENVESVNKEAEESQKLSPQEETSKPTGGRGRRAAKKDDAPQVSTPVASRKREQATKASDKSKELHENVESANKEAEESHKLSPQEETSKPVGGRGRRAAKKDDAPQVSTPVASRKREQATIKAEVEVKRKKSDEGENQEEPREVETPKRQRGRPRKQDTPTQTPTRKDVTPPDPSPSRNTRQRPSSAFSNSPEVSTPRRTNRMSTTAPATRLAQPGPAPKILFTGVVDTAGEETIRSLGGDIAKSVFDCTHLVTDRVRRTVKFLCALARGIPIVTLDWIDKCKKSGCFLSPAGFLVHDKEQEKNFNFLLSESLQKAKNSPLFEGYDIHVTANVKPDPDQMKDIICCSGATFLPKMPRTFKEKCVIVSCPEDAARCKSVPASVPITSAEFILSGILRQEVNPTAYLLNPPDTGPTPAKRRR